MKERPILFNAEMVRAILDGRKTQTRRPIKDPPSIPTFHAFGEKPVAYPVVRHGRMVMKWSDASRNLPDHAFDSGWISPFGEPGDRLWVREAHRFVSWGGEYTSDTRIEYEADGHAAWVEIGEDVERWCDRMCDAAVRAGAVKGIDGHLVMPKGKKPPLRPSIHLPRWACRLTLRVERVWVERLHDIDDAGARAEGFADAEAFRTGWADIYGESERDPWVWACEFSVEKGGAR